MALCRHCHRVIPCHCHTVPPVQIRPGVYLAGGTPSVPVSVETLERLVRVAMWVSRGQSMAHTPDPDPALGSVYPDATARRALGALDDAGLLQQFRTRATTPELADEPPE